MMIAFWFRQPPLNKEDEDYHITNIETIPFYVSRTKIICDDFDPEDTVATIILMQSCTILLRFTVQSKSFEFISIVQ